MSFSIQIHKYSNLVISFENMNYDLNDVLQNLSFKLPNGSTPAGTKWFIGVQHPFNCVNVVNNKIYIDNIEYFSDPRACVFPATKKTSILFANYIKNQLMDKYDLKFS